MIKAKDIKLFDDLTQLTINHKTYDLHNNYDLSSLTLSDCKLLFKLNHCKEAKTISVLFHDVEIVKLGFEFSSCIDNSTIDSLYRGRFERDGSLIEFSDRGKGYFYLELFEGDNIEFWSSSLTIEHIR